MEMEGMEGAILIFMLGNMEQTVARKHKNSCFIDQPNQRNVTV